MSLPRRPGFCDRKNSGGNRQIRRASNWFSYRKKDQETLCPNRKAFRLQYINIRAQFRFPLRMFLSLVENKLERLLRLDVAGNTA